MNTTKEIAMSADTIEGSASRARLRAAVDRVGRLRRELRDAEDELSRVVARFSSVVEATPEVGQRPLQATILVTPRRRHLLRPGTDDTYCGRFSSGEEAGRVRVDEADAAEVVTCADCRREAGLG